MTRRAALLALLAAGCDEPTRAVLRDAGVDATRDVPLIDVDPSRVGVAQPGACEVANGGCSPYARCVPAGAGARRCVCAAGLRMRDDQRGCDGVLLASVDRDGRAPATHSAEPTLAAGGRFVTFVSDAPRMASDAPASALDAPATAQCYVRDLRSGRTVVVSATAEGSYGAGGRCASPSITADGGRVGFLYAAALTLSAPRTMSAQVYARDLGPELAVGALRWLRLDASRPGSHTGQADGLRVDRAGTRFLVKTDSPLAANDDDNQMDLYLLRDPDGSVTRVSQRADGRPGAWAPCAGGNVGGWFALSGDGSTVSFNSARSLVSADTDLVRDPYLVQPDARIVELLAERRFTLVDGDCHVLELGTAVSNDGRWALFQSDNPRFDDRLAVNAPDYYLRDRAAATRGDVGLTRLRIDPGLADTCGISDDGRTAVLTSLRRIETGGSGAREAVAHLYRVDLSGTAAPFPAEIVDLTRDDAVSEGQPGAHSPSLAADGRSVAFVTTAPLVPEDQNGRADVYVRVFW